jgi:hypothetical protein
MHKLSRLAALGALGLALAGAAPVALASGGGANSGGVNSGGGGGTSGGGGGGGGGGGNRGGVSDVPTPTPAPPPPAQPGCATFTSTTAPVGYYLTWAALWHDYQIRSCNPQSEVVSVRVKDVNRATGNTDYTMTVAYSLPPGGSMTGVIDNDFAPFTTTYDLTYELVDATGAVVDSSSLSATTPDAR